MQGTLRQRLALALAVALLAFGLAVAARETHLLRRPEQLTIDARFQIRGTEHSKAAGVVLVDINAATFISSVNTACTRGGRFLVAMTPA